MDASSIIELIDFRFNHFTSTLSLPSKCEAVSLSITQSIQTEVLPHLQNIIASQAAATISSSEFGLAISTNIRDQLSLCIDFIFGTTLFLSAVCKDGILSYEHSPFSDHRAIYVNLDEHTLFQDSSTDPTAPSQRLLRLCNPEQCQRYLSFVHHYLNTHQEVFPRYTNLAHLTPPPMLPSQSSNPYMNR